MTVLKQYLVRLVRNGGAYPGVEAIRENFDRLRNRRTLQKFAKDYPDFVLPPPHLAYDAYSGIDPYFYMNSGRITAAWIAELIKKHVPNPKNILEWGCGPARILRHLPGEFEGAVPSFHGCDFNARSIAWDRDAFPSLDFKVNSLRPPLPYRDDEMDCLYSVSVFTHLSAEAHREYVNENLRIVRPGGIVIMALQGLHSRADLLPDEQKLMDAGELVIRAGAGVHEGLRGYAAFHGERYVREVLLKGQIILDHFAAPLANRGFSQDFWVIRK